MLALTPSSFAPWGAGLPLPGYHSFLPYYIVVLILIAIVIVTLTTTIIVIVVSVLIETGKGRAGRVEAWEKITSQNSATLRLPSTGTIGRLRHHRLLPIILGIDQPHQASEMGPLCQNPTNIFII